MQIPYRGRQKIWGGGGGIYGELEWVPRIFSWLVFVRDARFRSPAGFMTEFWYFEHRGIYHDCGNFETIISLFLCCPHASGDYEGFKLSYPPPASSLILPNFVSLGRRSIHKAKNDGYFLQVAVIGRQLWCTSCGSVPCNEKTLWWSREQDHLLLHSFLPSVLSSPACQQQYIPGRQERAREGITRAKIGNNKHL